MISGATRPIREEHRELLPHIERLRAAADDVGHVPGDVLRTKLDEAHDFLMRHLIPHAKAEDEVSWFQARPGPSLELVARTGAASSTPHTMAATSATRMIESFMFFPFRFPSKIE